jgi:mono/diheme cytochrome c family protein
MKERPAPTSTLVQVVGIAATGVAVLTASAAVAWSLRSRRENGSQTPDPVSVPAPVDRRAVALRTGRLAYQDYCARCHGPEGHGDGSDAERLDPPPRDFAATNWRFAPTADRIREVIVGGIPGTAMPGSGAGLTPRELEGLVAHVLTMAPPVSEPLVSTLVRAGFVAQEVPRAAPELLVHDLQGNPSALASHRGRPVLVMFWGTSCAHCLDEMPGVAGFVDRLRTRGVDLDVMAVCADTTEASVVRDVAGSDRGGPSLYVDTTGTARLHYDVQGLPTFVLIDGSGRLVARAEGARDWAAVADASGK